MIFCNKMEITWGRYNDLKRKEEELEKAKRLIKTLSAQNSLLKEDKSTLKGLLLLICKTPKFLIDRILCHKIRMKGLKKLNL